MQPKQVPVPSRLVVSDLRPQDAGRLMEFRGPGAHYVCEGGCRPTPAAKGKEVTVAATTPDGRIVGVGIVEPTTTAGEARITVAVHVAYQHDLVVADLLTAVAERARGLGYRRLVTCVARGPGDSSDWFRAAGLRTFSSLSMGGVTEVVLTLE